LLLAFPTQGMSPAVRLLLFQNGKTQAVSGSMIGSVNLSPTTPVNLTSLAKSGSSDWANWGYGSATGFNYKLSGSSQISNLSFVGGTTVLGSFTGPTNFTWIDGTPNASITNTPEKIIGFRCRLLHERSAQTRQRIEKFFSLGRVIMA
jgi:hypothetical protein